MGEKEFDEQMQAATQFILDSKDESVNYKVAAQRYQEVAEAYRIINDKTVQEVVQALQKRPFAEVPQEQLSQIEQMAERGAKRGVTTSQCQMPSTEMLAENISNLVLQKISCSVDDTIAKSMKRHRARIDVHHKHNHTNMYGQFASSEKNRNMMCWLALVNILSVVQMVLYLCKCYEVIQWDWIVFQITFVTTIAITIVGFVIRIFSTSA